MRLEALALLRTLISLEFMRSSVSHHSVHGPPTIPAPLVAAMADSKKIVETIEKARADSAAGDIEAAREGRHFGELRLCSPPTSPRPGP